MSLKIQTSNFIEKTFLELRPDGVTYCKTTGIGGTRKFSYAEIDCVLLSPTNALSLQVGKEIFTIDVKPSEEKHKTVVNTLISELRKGASLATP